VIYDTAVDELAPKVGGIAPACRMLGWSRATHHRHRRPMFGPPAPRPPSAKRLGVEEEDRVVGLLNNDRFCDMAPAQVWAALLDEGVYLASISTMYRLLRKRHQVRERRRQARRMPIPKPELVATAPNELWSWDITKLAGPYKWTWYHLYVILDVYSRYVPGWLVAPRESARLAEDLIASCVAEQRIGAGQLTIHADRGSSMTSKTVAQLLADLGVVQSHSRPHQSNDNPYSEAQFKTLKYAPAFPKRFASIHAARVFCEAFFTHYNFEHRHSGIALHTPATVHYGQAPAITAHRQQVLDAAYQANPRRFNQRPCAPRLPEMVWINPPAENREPYKAISGPQQPDLVSTMPAETAITV
jgi:putative transposase